MGKLCKTWWRLKGVNQGVIDGLKPIPFEVGVPVQYVGGGGSGLDGHQDERTAAGWLEVAKLQRDMGFLKELL